MRLPEEYAKYLGLGAEIAVLLVVPIISGYLIDNYFNVEPIGVITGSIIGLIGFFILVLKLAREQFNSDDKK
ncbi:MAG: AtpZ/AtpI family protein [Balneola sp.]